MEMHQVRYFLALCETLNFSRAAESCNVSQPSLTRAIKGLEEEFGGALLHRERNHTHLTELGRLIRPFLQQVLSQSLEAKQRAEAFANLESVTLTIGVMCTIGPQHLVDLMRTFHHEHPGIDLRLRDGRAEDLQLWLDQGDVDIALFGLPDPIPERYHALALYSERFVIAFSPGHRFEALASVRAKDLDGERYLSRINCEFGDHMIEIYEGLGVELTRPFRSEREDWILSMASAGLGFSFVPEFSIDLPGLLTRPLVEPEVTRTIHLVTVRGRPHSPAVGAFLQHTRLHTIDATISA